MYWCQCYFSNYYFMAICSSKTQIQNNQIEKIIKEYESDIENMDIIY